MNTTVRELTEFERFLNMAGFVRWETHSFLFIHQLPDSHDVLVAVCPFGAGQDNDAVELFITDVSETESVLGKKGKKVRRDSPSMLIGAMLELLAERQN